MGLRCGGGSLVPSTKCWKSGQATGNRYIEVSGYLAQIAAIQSRAGLSFRVPIGVKSVYYWRRALAAEMNSRRKRKPCPVAPLPNTARTRLTRTLEAAFARAAIYWA